MSASPPSFPWIKQITAPVRMVRGVEQLADRVALADLSDCCSASLPSTSTSTPASGTESEAGPEAKAAAVAVVCEGALIGMELGPDGGSSWIVKRLYRTRVSQTHGLCAGTNIVCMAYAKNGPLVNRVAILDCTRCPCCVPHSVVVSAGGMLADMATETDIMLGGSPSPVPPAVSPMCDCPGASRCCCAARTFVDRHDAECSVTCVDHRCHIVSDGQNIRETSPCPNSRRAANGHKLTRLAITPSDGSSTTAETDASTCSVLCEPVPNTTCVVICNAQVSASNSRCVRRAGYVTLWFWGAGVAASFRINNPASAESSSSSSAALLLPSEMQHGAGSKASSGGSAIIGVRIPSWTRATFYTNGAETVISLRDIVSAGMCNKRVCAIPMLLWSPTASGMPYIYATSAPGQLVALVPSLNASSGAFDHQACIMDMAASTVIPIGRLAGPVVWADRTAASVRAIVVASTADRNALICFWFYNNVATSCGECYKISVDSPACNVTSGRDVVAFGANAIRFGAAGPDIIVWPAYADAVAQQKHTIGPGCLAPVIFGPSRSSDTSVAALRSGSAKHTSLQILSFAALSWPAVVNLPNLPAVDSSVICVVDV